MGPYVCVYVCVSGFFIASIYKNVRLMGDKKIYRKVLSFLNKNLKRKNANNINHETLYKVSHVLNNAASRLVLIDPIRHVARLACNY